MHPKLYTIQEVADRYSCTVQTIYSWLAKGRLSAIKVGRRTMVPADVLEAFYSAHPPFQSRAFVRKGDLPERQAAA